MLKIQKSSLKIILPLIVLLVVAGVGGAFVLHKKSQNSSTVADQNTASDYVNYNPSTDEDKQRVEDNKEKVVARADQEKAQPSSSAGVKKDIKPFITYAGVYDENIEVGGYANVFEEDGKCTATITKDTAKVTTTVQAVRGANSVDCPVMSFKTSQFTQKGTWKVVIDYTSSSSNGTSDPKNIEIK